MISHGMIIQYLTLSIILIIIFFKFFFHCAMNVFQKTFRPWITPGIRKSSKRNQRFYEKFLKTRTTNKNMFETIKRKSKKNYNTIHKKYLKMKITLKNMEYYEGDNRQNKQIGMSSTYQTCNQQKRCDK